MSLNRDEKFVAERQRREDERIAAEAKRRAAKAAVAAAVPVLWDSLSPEGRVHIAMMATIKAGLRPATWPR
jgi:hypothetical protein